jgi:hypothetical protein
MHLILVSSSSTTAIIFILFYFIAIIITTNNAASSLQDELNQDGPQSRVLPNNLDWRTQGVITPVYDYTGSPYVTAVVMVGK